MQPGKRFLVWLAGLSVLGFLATDMYLPAFAAIQADLQRLRLLSVPAFSLFPCRFCRQPSFCGGHSPTVMVANRVIHRPDNFALGSLGMLWVEKRRHAADIAFCTGCGCLRRGGYLAALVTDYYPSQKVNRIFATIMPLVGLSPALAPLLGAGCWSIFLAGDFRHPVCHYRGADSAYFLAQTHDEGP